MKTTQWERPTQRILSNHGIDFQAADAPVMKSRKRFSYDSKEEEQTQFLPKSIPSHPPPMTVSSAASHVEAPVKVDTLVPPNWLNMWEFLPVKHIYIYIYYLLSKQHVATSLTAEQNVVE